MKTRDDLKTMLDRSKCDEISALASMYDGQPSSESLDQIADLVKESAIAWPTLSAQIERVRKAAPGLGSKQASGQILPAAVKDMEDGNILSILSIAERLEEEGMEGVVDMAELAEEVERRIGKAISSMMGDYYDADVIGDVADAIAMRIPGVKIGGVWHVAKTWR